MYVLRTAFLVLVLSYAAQCDLLSSLTGGDGVIGKVDQIVQKKMGDVGKVSKNTLMSASNKAIGAANKAEVITGEIKAKARSTKHETNEEADSVHRQAMDTVIDFAGDDIKLKTKQLIESKKRSKSKSKKRITTTPEPEEDEDKDKEEEE